MSDLKILAEYVNTNVPACKFVGISSDGELFVEFEHNNSEYMKEAKAQLKSAFPELKEVVAVIKPSIAQLTQMIEDLNALVEETAPASPSEDQGSLLDIGKF